MDIGALILRLGFGGIMLFAHGIPKLMKFSILSSKFADPIGLGPSLSLGLAIFAEVLCAALVIIGFKARWAAIPLAITMLVAALIVHHADPWKIKELAIIYLCGYVAIFFIGAGKFSVDHFMTRKGQ